jgi:hypothetical protein
MTSRERADFAVLCWVTFMIDKDLFVRTGLSPVMSLRDLSNALSAADLQHPERVLSLVMPESFKDRVYLPVYFTYSVLTFKIYTGLFAPSALERPEVEILRSVCLLDDAIEQWRQSIHPAFRPTITRHTLPSDALRHIPPLILSLKYHHSLALVHQTVSRCQSWSQGNDSTVEALRSSLTLSAQASRATLDLLRSTRLFPSREAFW